MYINNSGKVGIGTDDPDRLFHLKGTQPYIYLEDTDGATNKGNWEIGGYSGGGRLQFNNTNDDGTTKYSPMVLVEEEYGGAVAICRNNNGTSSLQIKNKTAAGGTLLSEVDSSGVHYHMHFISPSGTCGYIYTNGTTTTYGSVSDYRLKENITPISGSIDRLKQLKPSSFNFKVDSTKSFEGFIAHELQDVCPEAVMGDKDGVDNEGEPFYQSVDYGKLTILLTGALQEAIARIETLEAA
jgi:hypothetical protein